MKFNRIIKPVFVFIAGAVSAHGFKRILIKNRFNVRRFKIADCRKLHRFIADFAHFFARRVKILKRFAKISYCVILCSDSLIH